jgi:hypothetical protein
MKVIIAGGRDFYDLDYMLQSINQLIEEGKIIEEGLEIVCGMAKGADLLGFQLALDNDIPVHEFPANWELYGTRAGMIRNKEMAKFADAAIVFWDGESKGTYNMILCMNAQKKPCYIFNY